MKHVLFVAVFFVVFIATRVLVIYDHQKNCGCDKYDQFVFFSIPNWIPFLVAFIVAAVIQLTFYP